MANPSAAETVVPPPPRLTGDFQADYVVIQNWMEAFYDALVLQSGLANPSFQATANVDPNNLPDPAETTIANAQETANLAITALKNHNLFP